MKVEDRYPEMNAIHRLRCVWEKFSGRGEASPDDSGGPPYFVDFVDAALAKMLRPGDSAEELVEMYWRELPESRRHLQI